VLFLASPLTRRPPQEFSVRKGRTSITSSSSADDSSAVLRNYRSSLLAIPLVCAHGISPNVSSCPTFESSARRRSISRHLAERTPYNARLRWLHAGKHSPTYQAVRISMVRARLRKLLHGIVIGLSCISVTSSSHLDVRHDLHFPLHARGTNNDGSLPVYKNPEASIEDRINDLLPRMTVEEKVSQL
jgi:hypothetical protein